MSLKISKGCLCTALVAVFVVSLILMVEESQRGGVIKYTTVTGYFVQDEPCTNGSILNQASLDEFSFLLVKVQWGSFRVVCKYKSKCHLEIDGSSVGDYLLCFDFRGIWCLSSKNEKKIPTPAPLSFAVALLTAFHSRQRPTSVW